MNRKGIAKRIANYLEYNLISVAQVSYYSPQVQCEGNKIYLRLDPIPRGPGERLRGENYTITVERGIK